MSKNKPLKELPLNLKIQLAENIIIEEYMRNNGNVFLSWSGGKDSTILMHIALRLFPDIKIVFSNTTNELSEIIKYVKQFKKVNKNITTVYPKMNFKQVIRKHGFPLVSKETSLKVNELKHTNGARLRSLRYYGDKKGNSKLPKKWRFLAEQQFDVTNKCCYILKKEPLDRWAKENGNPTPLIALMSDESKLRQQLALYGKEDSKKAYPFLRTGWTESDIWEYSRKYNIRFAECYYDSSLEDGTVIKARTRTGCEFCGFGITIEKEDRFKRSKLTAPKKYDNAMKIENNGTTYFEAINMVKNPKQELLGLYGGTVRDIKFSDNSIEKFIFDIHTNVKECSCCVSKRKKDKTKIYEYMNTFIDIPNFTTGRKRIIETFYDWWECESCGMTLINHLHMFDLRFNVTKRLIDYIYENIDTKDEITISLETGLDIDTVFEIILTYDYRFNEAKENKRESIWFDSDNKLIA